MNTTNKPADIDPLYVIFEQHLYNFQDSDTDRKTFIGNVLKDYFTYLRRLSIVVPKSLEQSVLEELATQVNTMLVKKIYGFSSVGEFQKKADTAGRKQAQMRFTRLNKTTARRRRVG